MLVAPLIYLLDTSGSMFGSRITKINQIMKKTINDLKCVINNEEYAIKVAVLSFATCCRWITCGLTDVEKIQWEDLHAEGMTSLGSAFEELNSVLRREKLLMVENNQPMLRPVIILFTDGESTDLYEDKLNRLKKNDLFSKSLKFAIGLDNEINREVLIEFVESDNCLLEEKDFDITPQRTYRCVLAVSVNNWCAIDKEIPPRSKFLGGVFASS